MTNGQFTNYQPVWGRDQRVYFVSDRSGVDNIWSVTASGALDALQPGRDGITSRCRSRRPTNHGSASPDRLAGSLWPPLRRPEPRRAELAPTGRTP